VRKLWQGVMLVHVGIVWVLNAVNPCLPAGVVDCEAHIIRTKP